MGPSASSYVNVLVVIPCLNEQSHIRPVISRILHDPARDRLSIVVADGGSSDGTCRIVSNLAAENPQLRLIANPGRIQSAGINLAVRLFGQGHRWLLRLDAHAEYPENFISILLAEAARSRASSVVVAMRARGKNCFQRAAATAQNSILGAGGAPHRIEGPEGFVDHGHHALIDLNRFLILNGYDETQSHNEDAEFDARLTHSGGRIWLTRATHVTYFPRKRVRELFLQYRNYGYGRATTLLRHRIRPKIRQMLPACIAPCLLLAIFAPFRPCMALPAAVWLAICAMFGIALGLKERTHCAFAAGWAALIMHLAWSIGFWSAILKRRVANPFLKKPTAVVVR